MGDESWVGDPGDAAVEFVGVEDPADTPPYILVEHSEPFDIHFSDHTWSVWIQTDQAGGIISKGPTVEVDEEGNPVLDPDNDQIPVDWDDPDHRGGRAMFVNDAGVLVVDAGWVGAVAGGLSGVNLLDGEWHLAVMSVEMDTNGQNDTITLYVDGLLDGMSENLDLANQVPNVPGNLKFGWIGQFPDLDPDYFVGTIDDVRFFNYALTEDEVIELHENPGLGCEIDETGFIRGDTNADGSRNITDGVFVFSFLFTGGAEPPCKDAADTSDQGMVNITSGIYILNFLFLGGPEPPAPFPDCGSDTTDDNGGDLGCASFPPCEP